MKLLFDQNISFRIIKQLENVFPGSKQVKALGLENTSDTEIWEYAKINNFVIVTFDADFSNIASIKGNYPKIIWLRTGNTTTRNIAALLISNQSLLKDFVENVEFNEVACLQIEQD
ncbi:DUF5615 family PIN-like protein [Leeuwenhoekiella nanhaiensis]|uniref:DUF5615 domain-containing protein n=1 Tax=Leeuwenhoekiella nanhaiensis TaxID=1655491 RepID=A0A2G1VN47_9FLAO|nr:DUF5615 family PIN-like protein [Leeuwenhoekiella nanhaiensis]PHQ28154.1 hypothetical protein CJ305_16075 [Leeuwenhoekiella nanhaiensis]